MFTMWEINFCVNKSGFLFLSPSPHPVSALNAKAQGSFQVELLIKLILKRIKNAASCVTLSYHR